MSYNGVSSSTKLITCSVPQGSILGLLLFLIYINDLYNVCCDSVPILFADDTNLFYKGADFGELVKSINAELENISLWLKVNKFSLNVKKTHFIIFQRGKSPISHIEIKIDNQTIDKVDKTKFLGGVIDSKLSWKNHISLIVGKLSKSIGMIVKARELNRNALLTLYYSFVYPYLIYCNHVWGCTYQTNLKQLFILQKKALRIMCGKRKMDSTEHISSQI